MTSEPAGGTSPADPRPRAYGAGRVLVLVYGILAVAALGRSTVQIPRDPAMLAYWLSGFAALVYLVATVALAHNGVKMRRVAWVAVCIELVGVLVVGTWSFVRPESFPDATVWSHFGQGYGFVPLVLPFLGIAWLVRSDPARIARR